MGEGGLPCEGMSLLHEPVCCNLVDVRLDLRRVKESRVLL